MNIVPYSLKIDQTVEQFLQNSNRFQQITFENMDYLEQVLLGLLVYFFHFFMCVFFKCFRLVWYLWFKIFITQNARYILPNICQFLLECWINHNVGTQKRMKEIQKYFSLSSSKQNLLVMLSCKSYVNMLGIVNGNILISHNIYFQVIWKSILLKYLKLLDPWVPLDYSFHLWSITRDDITCGERYCNELFRSLTKEILIV